MTQVYLGILIDESRTDAMTQPSQDLIKGFYAKGEETIQQAIARACVAWADNKEHAQRLYDSGSMGDFMWSSPMFANAPLAKWTEGQDINSFLPIYDNEEKFDHPGAQNISCFLPKISDTIPSLLLGKLETSLLSVLGGGLGKYYGLRHVSKKSPGPIPFVIEDDSAILAWKQGRVRRGAIADWLSADHAASKEFMNIRTPTGDANRKAENIHIGFSIDDDMMQRIEDGVEEMHLIDPHDNRVVDTINPKDHFMNMIRTRGRTGEPFMYFRGNANRALPEAQKRLGLYSYASNLCLAGETKVILADGRKPLTIKQLSRESSGTLTFKVWSGRVVNGRVVPEVKNATAKLTGRKELATVTLKNGDVIRCTKDHELLTTSGKRIEAKDSMGQALESRLYKHGSMIANPADCRVVKVDFTGSTEDIYCLTVEGNSNFYISTGNATDFDHRALLVHNCFAGETIVATADGRNGVDIKTLAEESKGEISFPVYTSRKRESKTGYVPEKTSAFKSPEVVMATAFKTGTKGLIRVTLSDGGTFRCTPDHKLRKITGEEVEAQHSLGEELQTFFSYVTEDGGAYRTINSLSDGNSKQHLKIWKFHNGDIPEGHVIDHIQPDNKERDALTNLRCIHRSEDSFYGRDGKGRKNARYCGLTNKELISLAKEWKEQNGIDSFRGKAYEEMLVAKLAEGLKLPQSFSKYRFDGSWEAFYSYVNGDKEYHEVDDSTWIDNARKGSSDIRNLYETVLRKDVDDIRLKHFGLTVTNIEVLEDVEDVYCLNVPETHMFYILTKDYGENFNNSTGILTNNCTEVTLPANDERTPVCCLSSLNAERYGKWPTTLVGDLVRALDNALEHFIRTADWVAERYENPLHKELIRLALRKVIYSAQRERSIGLGVMGFHYALQQRNMVFGSPEAREFNKELFSYVKREAVAESLRLGEERGECPDAASSSDHPHVGRRNMHLLAIAPNSNNADMLRTSASCDPEYSNVYTKETRVGIFEVRNPYLKKVLAELGKDTEEVWERIAHDEGSVKNLEFLTDHQKAVFHTAFEIPQLLVVRMAADRQPEICQAQSVNLHFKPGSDINYVYATHFFAWKWGLKSLYYYRTEPEVKIETLSQAIKRKRLKDSESVEKAKGENIVYGTKVCPNCNVAKRLLNEMGVDFKFVDLQLVGKTAAEVTGDPACRTVPQVFIDGKWIGGINEVQQIFKEYQENRNKVIESALDNSADCSNCQG